MDHPYPVMRKTKTLKLDTVHKPSLKLCNDNLPIMKGVTSAKFPWPLQYPFCIRPKRGHNSIKGVTIMQIPGGRGKSFQYKDYYHSVLIRTNIVILLSTVFMISISIIHFVVPETSETTRYRRDATDPRGRATNSWRTMQKWIIRNSKCRD